MRQRANIENKQLQAVARPEVVVAEAPSAKSRFNFVSVHQQGSEPAASSAAVASSSSPQAAFVTSGSKSVPQAAPVDTADLLEQRTKLMLLPPRLIGHMELEQKLSGYRQIGIPAIRRSMDHGQIAGFWAVFGVLAEKGTPRENGKGEKFGMWRLTDLKQGHFVSMFLHGAAFRELRKEDEGTLLCIANPKILPPNEKFQDSVALSITSPQQVLIIGRARDFGHCKASRADGQRCTAVIDMSGTEYCNHHIKAAYAKMSTGRMELHHGTAHVNMKFAGGVNEHDHSKGSFRVMGVTTTAEAKPAKVSAKKPDGPYQSSSLNSMFVKSWLNLICFTRIFFSTIFVLHSCKEMNKSGRSHRQIAAAMNSALVQSSSGTKAAEHVLQPMANRLVQSGLIAPIVKAASSIAELRSSAQPVTAAVQRAREASHASVGQVTQTAMLAAATIKSRVPVNSTAASRLAVAAVTQSRLAEEEARNSSSTMVPTKTVTSILRENKANASSTPAETTCSLTAKRSANGEDLILTLSAPTITSKIVPAGMRSLAPPTMVARQAAMLAARAAAPAAVEKRTASAPVAPATRVQAPRQKSTPTNDDDIELEIDHAPEFSDQISADQPNASSISHKADEDVELELGEQTAIPQDARDEDSELSEFDQFDCSESDDDEAMEVALPDGNSEPQLAAEVSTEQPDVELDLEFEPEQPAPPAQSAEMSASAADDEFADIMSSLNDLGDGGGISLSDLQHLDQVAEAPSSSKQIPLPVKRNLSGAAPAIVPANHAKLAAAGQAAQIPSFNPNNSVDAARLDALRAQVMARQESSRSYVPPKAAVTKVLAPPAPAPSDFAASLPPSLRNMLVSTKSVASSNQSSTNTTAKQSAQTIARKRKMAAAFGNSIDLNSEAGQRLLNARSAHSDLVDEVRFDAKFQVSKFD
jgi:hypothetical protein